MRSTNAATAPDRYMQLIREFPLRRIRTAPEHSKATKIVLRLSIENEDHDTNDYLDVLIDLIADYEERAGQKIDASMASAAEIVRHRIDSLGISVNSLARLIGVPQSNLSEMLSGKRDWSKTAIRGLSTHLNISATRFLM